MRFSLGVIMFHHRLALASGNDLVYSFEFDNYRDYTCNTLVLGPFNINRAIYMCF